ncbi:acyclic terpene utilization AtuA family protein [Aquibacillus albus]|uniref:Acyclic terpene utilisation N-terminal domain-containing protein n=1 Tax=Aquibacillus albus TaxID=1168171 RepID=A0ABS2N4J5_9BACI|nr:hypothetical protein [Aquibacillus albus]
MKKVRIGSGAGYGGDRIEPALDIMDKGNVDYIIFECLAERTIALAQEQKIMNPEKGYNELLEYRMRKILPIRQKRDIKLITNMGAANPLAAAKVVKKIAIELGITNLKIAAVLGDDIFDKISNYENLKMIENGEMLSSLHNSIVSANAYIGISGIVQALDNNADIVITGRVSDPSLVLGPLVYEFGWETDNYDLLGKGTLAGHLLECGSQVTGGYFADPGYKDVPDLWKVGFPIGEIYENGEIVITKLEESGGIVNKATVSEQILYEIHDPANYYTPDVIADFSQVTLEELEINKVKITGATGKEKNNYFKTSVGYKDGYHVEGEISYGGSGAYERAKLAGEIIQKRLEQSEVFLQELKIDYIGINSLYKDQIANAINNNFDDFKDVRLRVAGRLVIQEDAYHVVNEVESLMTNGPAGGGGVRVRTKKCIGIVSILVPSKDIDIEVHYEEV